MNDAPDRQALKMELFGNVPKDTLTSFRSYHERNPEIFEKFKFYAFEMKNSGKKTYSAKCIMHRIRWEADLKSQGEFKINDAFIALYGRLLTYYHPEFYSFFERRTIRGLTDAHRYT